MELQKKDNINNLVECWKKATGNGLNILDEGRMAEFWNKRSENYSRNIEKDQRKKRTDEILEFLEEAGFSPEGSRVLDIGCGPGTLSLPLARLGAEVTALDISSGMLNKLKDSVKKESLPVDVIECSWWTADIDELGFRNKFDLVIVSNIPYSGSHGSNYKVKFVPES
ncbi:MAG TPA: methyltransferase domain-containing protein, partial [Methanosarcina sp.]|nr:methyltransferase domain-containing protein [Methanosarcina sp.]